MVIRELFVALGIQADNKALKDFDTGLKRVRGTMVMAAAAAGSVAAGIGFLTRTTANYADEIRKTSQRIGVNSQALQRLRFAGELAGMSTDEMTNAMRFLGRASDETRQGVTSYREAFQRLSPEILKAVDAGANQEETLMLVADRFKDMEDGAEKTALAMRIFGRSGSNLIPLLNGGADAIRAAGVEAEELGIVFSEDAQKSAELFNDSIKRLHGALEGLRNSIGIPLINAIQPTIVKFQEFIKVNREAISEEAVKAFNDFISAFMVLGKMLWKAIGLFRKLTEFVGGFANLMRFLGIILGTIFTAKMVSGIMLMVKAFGIAAALKFGAILALVAGVGLMIDAIVANWDSIKGFFSMLGKGAKNLFSRNITKDIEDAIGQPTINAVAAAGQPSTGMTQSAQMSGMRGVVNNNSVKVDIDVDASNMTPQQARDAVSEGVENGLESILNQANEIMKPQMEN
jgi:hypothetical protein